jgi:hypothetical protein
MRLQLRANTIGRCALSCSLLLAAIPAFATDYYVSPSGNDKKSGSGTAAKPWKTIAHVNQQSYQPGDRILFQGGATFPGTLTLSSTSRGTAASPITFASYGSGKATISPGSGGGFSAYNTAGVVLSNLIFAGSGAASNTNHGINFYADVAGGVKLDTITIDSVEVKGFGRVGIIIGSWNGLTGFQNIRITNTLTHDNVEAGIMTYGDTNINTIGWPHRNIYVGNTQAYNNLGKPGTATASGHGIVVAAAENVIIERCLAYNNGQNNTANGGTVGIWAYDATNVAIQYNEAHHNHTNSVTDGGGFDLDGGVTNSVLQYNFSHDNDGPGFLLCQYSGARPFANNVVRYNISQNDGRKNGIGAITFYNAGSGINNTAVYNNTVYITPAPAMPRALYIMSPTSNVSIRNNIFVAAGGVPVVDIASGQSGLSLQGNNYWAAGAAPTFTWSYGSYSDLASFRSASGQEMLNGSPVGMSLDPRLAGAGSGVASGYKLVPGSPMIDTGLTLGSLFGIAVGPNDYFGVAIARGAAYDVGASEY